MKYQELSLKVVLAAISVDDIIDSLMDTDFGYLPNWIDI